jgi:hypothetical protein
LSITIIAWLLILVMVSAFPTLLSVWADPAAGGLVKQTAISNELYVALILLVVLIILACAIAILKGKNWGRVIYVAFTLLGFMGALAVVPQKASLLPSLILQGVIAFFLFRPAANAFFGVSYFGARQDAADR